MADPEKLSAKPSPQERRRAALDQIKNAENTNCLIYIPSIEKGGTSRYECKVNGKKITVYALPVVRFFQGGIENYNKYPLGSHWGVRPLPDKCVYTFSVEDRDGTKKEKSILSESIQEFLGMSQEEQNLVEDVLTMPIEPENPDSSQSVEEANRHSLAAVLHIFHPSYFRGIGDQFRGGHNPEFYYETLLNGLLLEYQKATNKKYFLLRLFRWLKEFHTTKWGDKTHAIDEDVSKFLPEWFKSNRGLFNGDGRENQVFEAGYRALRYWPDKRGEYTVKDIDGREVSVKYSIERSGWVWMPKAETYKEQRDERWRDLSEVFVYDKVAHVGSSREGLFPLSLQHIQVLEVVRRALPWDQRFLGILRESVPAAKKATFEKGVQFLQTNGFAFAPRGITRWKDKYHFAAEAFRDGNNDEENVFVRMEGDTLLRFRFTNGEWKWSLMEYYQPGAVHTVPYYVDPPVGRYGLEFVSGLRSWIPNPDNTIFSMDPRPDHRDNLGSYLVLNPGQRGQERFTPSVGVTAWKSMEFKSGMVEFTFRFGLDSQRKTLSYPADTDAGKKIQVLMESFQAAVK